MMRNLPPPPMQDEGTARTLRIAEYLNIPVYIVHVMSGGAMREIGLAKARGVRAIGEAIASGIAAVEGKIWDPDFKARRVVVPCMQLGGGWQAGGAP